MTVNRASARYEGFGKEGKGSITTKSGVLDKQPYGFGTRFEGQPGTNPEELIAAAHAACFTMALSFGLARAGYNGDTLETSRSEEHTSELQSLMRISYAVFCLKKKKNNQST